MWTTWQCLQVSILNQCSSDFNIRSYLCSSCGSFLNGRGIKHRKLSYHVQFLLDISTPVWLHSEHSSHRIIYFQLAEPEALLCFLNELKTETINLKPTSLIMGQLYESYLKNNLKAFLNNNRFFYICAISPLEHGLLHENKTTPLIFLLLCLLLGVSQFWKRSVQDFHLKHAQFYCHIHPSIPPPPHTSFTI